MQAHVLMGTLMLPAVLSGVLFKSRGVPPLFGGDGVRKERTLMRRRAFEKSRREAAVARVQRATSREATVRAWASLSEISSVTAAW